MTLLVDHPPCSPLTPLKERIYCPSCERVVPFVNRECVDCNTALHDATWRIPVSVIPRDGEKHPCGNCGEGAFFWWDRDGWDREGVIVDDGRVDVDCSGVTEECPNCRAVLVAEGLRADLEVLADALQPRDKQATQEGR